MAIRVMSQVWEYEWESPTETIILLALADWADDSGGKIFPSIALVAYKAQTSERTVQRTMARLRKMGVLVVVRNGRGGRGKTTEYRLDLTRGVKKSPYIPPYEKGDSDDTVTSEVTNSDTGGSNTLTPVTQYPDIAVSHYPSINIKEPPVEPPLSVAVEVPEIAVSESTRPSRPQDPLFDALLIAIYGEGAVLSKADNTRIGMAAAELHKLDATPEEVHQRVAIYKGWGDYRLTPQAIVRNWERLGQPKEQGSPRLLRVEAAWQQQTEDFLKGDR